MVHDQQDLNLSRSREVLLPKMSFVIDIQFNNVCLSVAFFLKENAKASIKEKEKASSFGKGRTRATNQVV